MASMAYKTSSSLNGTLLLSYTDFGRY